MTEGAIILSILVVVLFAIRLISLPKENAKGWKVKKVGNGKQSYSERIEGEWKSITFRVELYSKDASRHSIIIPNNWSDMPEWAQTGKEEILKRLKEYYKQPLYTIIFTD